MCPGKYRFLKMPSANVKCKLLSIANFDKQHTLFCIISQKKLLLKIFIVSNLTKSCTKVGKKVQLN